MVAPYRSRVGPDGAVYVGDFYSQAVIHNDTRGPDHNAVNAAVRPDRDDYFGRIWRLDHKQAKKIAVPNSSKASDVDIAKALSGTNRHTRMTAHRLLVEHSQAKEVSESGSGKGIASEAISAVAGGLKSESASARMAAL